MSYFKIKEFECPCCGKVTVSGWLIHLLNQVRENYGKPIYINSGFRCKKHNKEVGGKPDSAHLEGFAADLRCTNSTDRFLLLFLLFLVGFKRIGIHEKFIHVDVAEKDEGKPQEVLWMY